MSLSISEEALLKTLAVMTSADTNVMEIEVEEVQKIMQDTLGVIVTSADVRVAAKSEYIEDRQIDKYLKSIVKKLNLADKKMIISTLKAVILADDKAHPGEVKMFNSIAAVLDLTPAELVLL